MFVPPRVYVSFAPQDEAYALAIINGLLARGAQVWTSATAASSPGPHQAALNGGEWFIVMHTPDAVASPSVQSDVQMALAAHAAQPKCGLLAIIPTPVDVSMLPLVFQRIDAVNQPPDAMVQYIARIMELPGGTATPPPVSPFAPPIYGAPSYGDVRTPAPPFTSTPWPATPGQPFGAMHPIDGPAARLPTSPSYGNPVAGRLSRRVLLAGAIGAVAVAAGGFALFSTLEKHGTSTAGSTSTSTTRPGTPTATSTTTTGTSPTFLQSPQFQFSCTGHTDAVTMVAWALHGNRLASASGAKDSTARIWDATSGHHLLVYPGHTLGVSSVDWSHDGTLVVSSANDGTVQIWDPATGTPQKIGTYRQHFGGGTGALSAARWSPNDQLIASVGADAARIWNAATGNDVITPVPASSAFSDVSWSPDGTTIAVGSFDDRVYIIAVASGNVIQTWSGEQHPIQAVAWSPTASVVASGDNRPGVYLFDPRSGNAITTYAGNGSGINGLAWAHDGAFIASAGGGLTSSSGDLRVLVWNVQTLETVSQFYGHAAYVNSVAWSPDDTRIASGSDDRTIQVWRVR